PLIRALTVTVTLATVAPTGALTITIALAAFSTLTEALTVAVGHCGFALLSPGLAIEVAGIASSALPPGFAIEVAGTTTFTSLTEALAVSLAAGAPLPRAFAVVVARAAFTHLSRSISPIALLPWLAGHGFIATA